jgi:8-oxo-dGTP diphosphatase
MSTAPRTEVVAAIIEREGQILIGQRKAGERAHALRWEFPGGKIEPGETPAEALARELDEELGIAAKIGAEVTRYEFAYRNKPPILLIFLHVARFTGEPVNRVFEQIAWVERSRLPEYDFLEGDIDFVRRFAACAEPGQYTEAMRSPIRMIDPTQNEFLAQLESKTKSPHHFFRTMANRPEVLKNFPPLYGAIMGPGSVDRRTKELVYLTCSYTNDCAYCKAAHIATAAKAGINEAELRTLADGRDDGFNASERAAIHFARELTRTANAHATHVALAEHFNDEQMVEITLVAAMANFTNRFNNGLIVEPEE